MVRTVFACACLALLAACGRETPPQAENEISGTAPEGTTDRQEPVDSAPGMMPPAPEYTADGAVITARQGETVILTFPLPDGASTSHGWTVQRSTNADVFAYAGKTTAMQGELRYNELRLVANSPGETELVFVRFADGEATDDQRTVTFRVE